MILDKEKGIINWDFDQTSLYRISNIRGLWVPNFVYDLARCANEIVVIVINPLLSG